MGSQWWIRGHKKLGSARNGSLKSSTSSIWGGPRMKGNAFMPACLPSPDAPQLMTVDIFHGNLTGKGMGGSHCQSLEPHFVNPFLSLPGPLNGHPLTVYFCINHWGPGFRPNTAVIRDFLCAGTWFSVRRNHSWQCSGLIDLK